MKKQYLISMTAFVLANAWKASGWTRSDVQIRDNAFTIQIKYAKFLSQKNELGFFVPCDEKGNVLTEPKEFKDWMKSDHYFNASESVCHDCRMFKKAKERVLFKGFEPSKVNDFQVNYKGENGFTFNLLAEGTVEDLIWLNRGKFELTESAIKKIGLE